MGMPTDIGIIDTMIGFPAEDFKMYDFIRAQLKDPSAKFDFPVEYMFKNVPKELYGSKDPISLTLHEMDRFVPMGNVDPNRGMDGIRDMVRQYEKYGVRAFGAFNAGYNPQVGISDPL